MSVAFGCAVLLSLHCGSDDADPNQPPAATSTGACDSVDCGPHGVCTDGACTCRDGYTGARCEIPPDGGAAGGSADCEQRCLDGGHTSGACQARPAPTDATLLFRSGFEEPVTLSKASASADLHGADDGFDWDDLDSYFNYVAPDAEARGLVETRFSDPGEPVYAGARSLYQAQWQMQDGAQNRLQFFGADSEFGPHIFSRRWLYWPDSNEMFQGDSGGTSINGVRQTDNSASIYVELVNRDGALSWEARCLDYTDGETYYHNWLKWIAVNETVPVPLNRWFRMDFYVYRHATEGIVRLWIDDDLVFDITPENPPQYHNWSGPGVMTKNNDTDRWFSKLADIDTAQEFEQWVDAVEIWQGGIPTPDTCGATGTDLGADGCSVDESCCCR